VAHSPFILRSRHPSPNNVKTKKKGSVAAISAARDAFDLCHRGDRVATGRSIRVEIRKTPKLLPFGDKLRNLLEDLFKELYELEEAHITTTSFETLGVVENAGMRPPSVDDHKKYKTKRIYVTGGIWAKWASEPMLY